VAAQVLSREIGSKRDTGAFRREQVKWDLDEYMRDVRKYRLCHLRVVIAASYGHAANMVAAAIA
jgi:hypothetical protein